MKSAIITIGLLCAVCLAGCSQDQIDSITGFLHDANSVADGANQFAHGPAGAVLPPVVRTIMELLVVTAATALGLWQKIKHNLTKDTLRAVSKGVENSSDPGAVKAEIQKAMNDLAGQSRSVTYAKLNGEIDKAKAS